MRVGYILRRVGVFFLVVWAAATVNFAIPRLSPADPIKEALLHVTSLFDLATGNLGISIRFFPANVGDLILLGLPWTIVLVGVATVITFVIGTVLGAFMAWSHVPGVVKVLGPPLLTLSAIPYYLL